MGGQTLWLNKNEICLEVHEFLFPVTILFIVLRLLSHSDDKYVIVLIAIINWTVRRQFSVENTCLRELVKTDF